MDCSTRSQSFAVSSIRVPVLARRCKMNRPLSTEGKKSCPSHRMSRAAERQISRKAGTNQHLASTAVVNSRLYDWRNRSKLRSKALSAQEKGFRERPGFCSGAFRRYIASVGTNVRERTYDAAIAKMTASASG